MLFLNTRPEGRQHALTAALTSHGYEVIELPLLALQSTDLDHTQAMQQLNQMAAIVVVSPTAVELGMQALTQAQIALSSLVHVQWIAVGKGTADALAEYGIDAWVPSVETSEGMLDLPILRDLPEQAGVAFWRGEGGRTFMMEHLKAEGRQVLNIVLYARSLPKNVVQDYSQVLKTWPDVVLITSEASWKFWQQLAHDFDCAEKLTVCRYVVLGSRLYGLIKEKMNISTIYQVDSLHPDHILAILTQIKRSANE